MSGVTRRSLLGGVAGISGLAVVPGVIARPSSKLHVFDSRLGTATASARAFHDIANEDSSCWRASRDLALKPGDHVTGVTRWSDWVALRGLFGERGLRTLGITVTGNIASWRMG